MGRENTELNVHQKQIKVIQNGENKVLGHVISVYTCSVSAETLTLMVKKKTGIMMVKDGRKTCQGPALIERPEPLLQGRMFEVSPLTPISQIELHTGSWRYAAERERDDAGEGLAPPDGGIRQMSEAAMDMEAGGCDKSTTPGLKKLKNYI